MYDTYIKPKGSVSVIPNTRVSCRDSQMWNSQTLPNYVLPHLCDIANLENYSQRHKYASDFFYPAHIIFYVQRQHPSVDIVQNNKLILEKPSSISSIGYPAIQPMLYRHYRLWSLRSISALKMSMK